MIKYFVSLLIIPGILWSCHPQKLSGVLSVAEGIKIGWASTDITPIKPVQLIGQYDERISQGVHGSLYATAMAIESASGDMQAIMVSIEAVAVAWNLQKNLRNLLFGRIPGFNLKNLIINATHTHTAPYPFTSPDRSQPAGMMTGDEYRNQILLPRLADVVVASWNLLEGDIIDSWSRLTTHATAIASAVINNFSSAQSSRRSSVELNNQVRDYTLTQKNCYGNIPFVWELHTIRIGNAVFANNPFELYIDFGNAIKAQSMAAQTFLVQLSGNASDDGFSIEHIGNHGYLYIGNFVGYLPTARAVSGGKYGSWDDNGRVGPEGGAQLVSQTVSLINSMFTMK